MKYTIIAFTENKPGILYRIADLFLRRKINIESLTVSETETHGISRFTIVVDETHEIVEKVVKQLYRIVEVTKVFEMKDSDLIYREIAFIKVSTKTPDRRRDVEELVVLFGARVSDIGQDYLVAEMTGTEEQIQSLFLALKPFGVKEFVQSGRIAVVKDTSSVTGKFASFVKEPSHTVAGIELSAIKRLELMGRQEKDVVSLAQGIPSFSTPIHIREAAKKAIDDGNADKYTPGYGIEELRKVIAKKLKRDNNINVDASQVTVTHGGIEAMIAAFIAILNRDDEIIFLTPDYASHITQAIVAHYGGRPVFVPLNENDGWKFQKERLAAAIT
ncbi:acetolactate synthase small subunit, partial [Candidatus Microgenomates bacterium]|nr:acetolactate synthase small subunit [Candidatus Microgenomates bacterium]